MGQLENQKMSELANFVNNNGVQQRIILMKLYSTDWNKVKEVLRGNRPISDLGCNQN